VLARDDAAIMFDHINQIPHWGLLRMAFIAAVLCAAGLIAGAVALLRRFRRNRRQRRRTERPARSAGPGLRRN
jgi:uncharacterized membrane protein YidH (DUF202 family)